MHQLLIVHFQFFHKFKIYFIIIILNEKLSRFYQYVYISTVTDKLPRTTNYSLLFRSQSLCRTLFVYRSKELAAYGIGRILLANVSNVIRDAMRKSIRSRQILLNIEQAMFSYNAVRSLKKLKYS